MEKLSSNLLALNVGNVFALTHLEAAEVLSELPNHQVNVRARDATVFRFSTGKWLFHADQYWRPLFRGSNQLKFITRL